jgi:hypothetical protein
MNISINENNLWIKSIIKNFGIKNKIYFFSNGKGIAQYSLYGILK